MKAFVFFATESMVLRRRKIHTASPLRIGEFFYPARTRAAMLKHSFDDEICPLAMDCLILGEIFFENRLKFAESLFHHVTLDFLPVLLRVSMSSLLTSEKLLTEKFKGFCQSMGDTCVVLTREAISQTG